MSGESKTLHYATFERFYIMMTLEQAQSAGHQGQCDEDVLALSHVPHDRGTACRARPESLGLRASGIRGMG